jgi:hypothetical protein
LAPEIIERRPAPDRPVAARAAPAEAAAKPVRRPPPPLPSLRATERRRPAERSAAAQSERAHSLGILRFGLGQS